MKKVIIILGLFILQAGSYEVEAQEHEQWNIDINTLFVLVLQNNQDLKISRGAMELSTQNTSVAKLDRLPEIASSATVSYLGNGLLLSKDFSKSSVVAMPNFGNTYSFEVNEVIFKGNTIKNTIEASRLSEQLTALDYDKDRKEVKLLVADNFFDLHYLYSQSDVYMQNIKLAEDRLKRIKTLHKQGLVTRNDIIRSEIQLSELRLSQLQVNNLIVIVNHELTIAAGLPSDIGLVPVIDDELRKEDEMGLTAFKEASLMHNTDIKQARIGTEIAEKELQVTKGYRLPLLSWYAGVNMNRPITIDIPAQDAYFNTWQTGIRLTYAISSIYKSPTEINKSKIKVAISNDRLQLSKLNAEKEVQSAYILHQQAIQEEFTRHENVKLAEDNFKIIEVKYLNQNSLLIDMIDASNAKLEAELQFSRAGTNVIYTYYKLLKLTSEF